MYMLAFTGFIFVLCVREHSRTVHTHPRRCRRHYIATFSDARLLEHRWMKREAVSETRRRVTRHLREIDAPVDENNWFALSGTSVGQY